MALRLARDLKPSESISVHDKWDSPLKHANRRTGSGHNVDRRKRGHAARAIDLDRRHTGDTVTSYKL